MFNQCDPHVYRPGVKEPEGGLSDEQQESSDDDMDWSGNNSLFANLSIPQLDGAADESSGESSLCRDILRQHINVSEACLTTSSSIMSVCRYSHSAY